MFVASQTGKAATPPRNQHGQSLNKQIGVQDQDQNQDQGSEIGIALVSTQHGQSLNKHIEVQDQDQNKDQGSEIGITLVPNTVRA